MVDILFELDENGLTKTRYTHGNGFDEPISMYRNEETYYYHQDHLNNVRFLTDSNELIAAEYDYYPFGDLSLEISTVENPYKYTGREYDEDVSLYYYRHVHPTICIKTNRAN